MIIVNYEVYVLEQPRGWMLHARFPRQERESAITEAKELEQALNVRVKVVRETYYTDDNVFEEAEVYISGMTGGAPSRAAAAPASARPAPPRGAGGGRAASSNGKPANGKTAGRKPAAPAARKSPARSGTPAGAKRSGSKAYHLLGRLLAITALALAAALLSIKATPNVIMTLWEWGFRLDINPQTYNRLLFAVFVLTFLMVAVPLAIRFLPRQTEMPLFRRPHLPDWQSGPKVDKKLKKSLDKLAGEALREAEDVIPAPAEAFPPPPVAEEVLPEILPGPDEDLPEILPDADDVLKDMEEKARREEEKARREDEKARREAEEARRQAEAEEPPAPEETKPPAGTSSAESQLPTVNRFLNGAVNAVKSAVPVLDSYNKFALHLYMAGGVETLSEFRKVNDAGKERLTVSALETLGTKADLARKFHEKLPEYLLEPRYLGVVQAGRDAMGDFLLGGEADAHGRIKDVMKEWNRPADKKASIVTVMFTDMVGSTDLTQARGDVAAQEIVRRHNSIVRGALAQFSGKEIKHTGDGIMASFASAASAVEATVSIQRQVTAHNQRSPDLELHLRIGLNAGEPIEEEDDLFGTTVQLAARVCAATSSDQTLCTGVVKDLSFGKGGSFRPMGERMLKGFRDPIALFEVIWE